MKFFELNNKSFTEQGVVSHKELWEKVKGEFKGFSIELPVAFEKKTVTKADNSTEEVLTMIFSTPDRDRHGDILLQNFDLTAYKKNPVLIDSHNYDSITHIIGKVNDIRVESNNLKGEIEFAIMNPKGQLAKEMSHAGFINTSSVGFIPTEFDGNGVISKMELLENSLVSVPANARALFEKVAEDIKKEVEVFEKEIKEDITVQKIVEVKSDIDKKKKTLELITLALRDMNKSNRNQTKRLIFKAVSSL